jgi:hypothetical protein
VDDGLEPITSLAAKCHVHIIARGKKRNVIFECLEHGAHRAFSVYPFERKLWVWSTRYLRSTGSGRAA